ncbi:MAG: phosphatase PAP2 family protein [Bacteroidota bacterium]
MNKLKLFVLAALVANVSFLFAQSPYSLNPVRESAFIGAGLGMLGGSYLINEQRNPFSEDDLGQMSRSNVPAFERWVTYQHSANAESVSDILLITSQWTPLLMMPTQQFRKDWMTVALMYGETALLTRGLTGMAKTTFQRARPYVYNDEVDIADKMTNSSRRSFFSGHTSQTAAMTFFTAKVYADYHPDSKWKPVVWTAAAVVPAVTGYLRMESGKHFTMDVATGYAVGAAVGYLVPHFHKKKAGGGTGWSVLPAGNGVLIQRQF